MRTAHARSASQPAKQQQSACNREPRKVIDASEMARHNYEEQHLMVMDPLLVFERYNFAQLDRSWIKRVWDSSFTSVDNVPDDYLAFLASREAIELLDNICGVVGKWIARRNDDAGQTDSPEDTDITWQTLVTLNLDIRALLAILAFYIKRGQEFGANREARKSCLRATSLYLRLLAIPGSNAFQAFHPGLYESALKTFALTRYLTPSNEKAAGNPESEAPNDEDAAADLDHEVLRSLSKVDSASLTRGLNGVIFDLVKMLESVSTSLDPRSMELTVFRLVELTKLADETMTDFSQLNKVPNSTNLLAYHAYVALRLLCNPKHAAIATIARTICKHLLPHFLSTSSSSSSSSSNSSKLSAKKTSMIRESSVHFLKTLLAKFERDARSSILTLVQHLMIKSPERLDGRQKQATVVIKLMNICGESDGNVYEKCLKDLVLLSHHERINCRIFGQEIIGRYLVDLANSRSCRSLEDDESVSDDRWTTKKKTRLLLAAALSRCVDSSSMVRGRAIATLAEYTDNVDDPRVREIFEETEATQEMPGLEELIAAIEDNEAENILPNCREIVEMLRKRGEDERALVRRSALQVLRNVILVSPTLLAEATPTLREHCRDSALTVRRFAIRVLTQLLERFPGNSSLCRDWVDSVVPRVFDAEPKVQEEVLEALERLTIGKIVARAANGDRDEDAARLPWRIVNEILEHRMADHLTKACGIWSNGGRIKAATIANIKSHIGTDNNVGAWVLLASMAEHRSLGNMTNYYSYYERALKGNDDDDDNGDDGGGGGFSSSFVIQVLRHCWPSFDDESQRKIRSDLLKHLKRHRVRVALISHCLDILHGIDTLGASRRPAGSGGESAPTEISGTLRELARLSEATITRLIEEEEGGEEEEKNRDKDPGTILLRAICTLGHASFLCSEKISHAILRTLQGFLLEWGLLPAPLRARRELQGAAVAVLGQQALRDRDVAQEMTPIFGKLLRNTRQQDSPDARLAGGAAVRINAAKALADICVRFTALVEPYLPDMCVSMKDSDPVVRQAILVIFIQLLAEDFIKINGPFFFHILSMLNDGDSTIRRMTVFLVKERLLSRNKSLVTQQFVNCIFHLNNYEGRTTAGNSQRARRAKEREALTLPGEAGTAERRKIYDFLLEHLDAPGKLTVLADLTRQIFRSSCGRAARRSRLGELNVKTQRGICVFRDAIYVLSSETLQPNSCVRVANVDEENTEENTTTTTTAAVAVIVEAMKKHRLRVLLPGLVELKRRLARAKSTLVADVATFIAKILADYNKEQLESLHNEYPKLEREIARDIRERDRVATFAAQQKPSEAREAREKRDEATSSTPKKSRLDATLLLRSNQSTGLTPADWTPRIVLRRISSLTYPEVSESRANRAFTPLTTRASDADQVTPRKKTRSSNSESVADKPTSSPLIGDQQSSSQLIGGQLSAGLSIGGQLSAGLSIGAQQSSSPLIGEQQSSSPSIDGQLSPSPLIGGQQSSSPLIGSQQSSNSLISGRLSSPKVVLRRLSTQELPRFCRLRSISESSTESGRRRRLPNPSTRGQSRKTRSSTAAATTED